MIEGAGLVLQNVEQNWIVVFRISDWGGGGRYGTMGGRSHR